MRFLLFLLFISFGLFSQDTIHFTNNEVKAVKISEVGVENIKYHNFNNIEGPLYIVPKSEVNFIRYTGGLVETYNKKVVPADARPIDLYEAQKATEAANKKNEAPKPPPAKDTTFYKMSFISNKIVYKNRPINEKYLRNLVYDYPNENTKIKLVAETDNLKKYKKRQLGFLIGGLAGAGALLYGGLEVAYASLILDESPPDALFPVVLGGAVVLGVTGPLISMAYKNKRVQSKAKIVKLYNEGR